MEGWIREEQGGTPAEWENRGLEINLGLVLVSLLSSCVSFSDYIFSEINMGIIITPLTIRLWNHVCKPRNTICTHSKCSSQHLGGLLSLLSLLLLLILDGEEILKAVSRVLNVSEKKDRVALIVIKSTEGATSLRRERWAQLSKDCPLLLMGLWRVWKEQEVTCKGMILTLLTGQAGEDPSPAGPNTWSVIPGEPQFVSAWANILHQCWSPTSFPINQCVWREREWEEVNITSLLCTQEAWEDDLRLGNVADFFSTSPGRKMLIILLLGHCISRNNRAFKVKPLMLKDPRKSLVALELGLRWCDRKGPAPEGRRTEFWHCGSTPTGGVTLAQSFTSLDVSFFPLTISRLD